MWSCYSSRKATELVVADCARSESVRAVRQTSMGLTRAQDSRDTHRNPFRPSGSKRTRTSCKFFVGRLKSEAMVFTRVCYVSKNL